MKNDYLFFIGDTILLFIIVTASLLIYRDARKRRMWALLWAYSAIFLPVISWIIYILIRGLYPRKPCPDCQQRVQTGDIVCDNCSYNFTLLARERGLVTRPIPITRKIMSFFV